jgi:hypothetical protein
MSQKPKKFKLGTQVYVPIDLDRPEGDKMPGTVTQVGKHKVRVLVPIRKFLWVPVELLTRC